MTKLQRYATSVIVAILVVVMGFFPISSALAGWNSVESGGVQNIPGLKITGTAASNALYVPVLKGTCLNSPTCTTSMVGTDTAISVYVGGGERGYLTST